MVAALAAVGLASTAVLAGCSSGDDGASDGGGDSSESADGGDSGGGETCADNPDNPLCGSSDTNMQGKSIEFGYSRIGGWPPSSAPEAMWPAFQSYAKETYGYKVRGLELGSGSLSCVVTTEDGRSEPCVINVEAVC